MTGSLQDQTVLVVDRDTEALLAAYTGEPRITLSMRTSPTSNPWPAWPNG
jgi:hypothetical protein